MSVVGDFIEHMARAYELVLANCFIGENKNYWGVNISLALQLVGQEKSRWNTESIDKLLWHGGIYSDLELLKRKEMDYEKAVFIVKNTRSKQAEPSVMSRIVTKYGSSILSFSDKVDISYVSAASFINPFLSSYNTLANMDRSYLEIPTILGDNITFWDNYKMLENSYEQNFLKMAETATKL